MHVYPNYLELGQILQNKDTILHKIILTLDTSH